MKSRVLNMTEGNPLSLLIVFSIPMLIGNLFQQTYNIADSVIVGRLIGANALAAVGATNSVSFLFFSVCNGIGSGGGIVTSQVFGAGKDEQVRRAITNSAYLMLASSLIMAVLAYVFTVPVLRLTGTPQEIFPDAVLYMHMCCIGVPFVAVYNYASSMLRALGDSRTPLFFLIFACLMNVSLDVLFVYSFHLGVFGAALATMLSQLVAGLGCLAYAVGTNPYFHLKKQDYAFDRNISFQAVKIGLPLALQWSMIAVSSTALQTVVNSFGTVAVAAFTATNRIEQVLYQFYGSLSQALATFTGQNYGAGKMERIRTGMRKSMGVTVLFSLLMLGVMFAFGFPVIRAFVAEPEVVRLGGAALRITSLFYVFLGVIYMTRGVLNGVGDALFAFINGIVEMACRIGIPFFLTRIPGVGVWGIWWTAGLTWGISALFCSLRYFSWRRRQNETAATRKDCTFRARIL